MASHRSTARGVTRRAFLQSTAAASAALATGRLAAPVAATEPTADLDSAANLPFRLATGGSYLAARLDATETELLVATDSGNRPWSYASDYYIECGTEVMQVVGITGTVSPQVFSVIRSTGVSHAPGTSVQIVEVAEL